MPNRKNIAELIRVALADLGVNVQTLGDLDVFVEIPKDRKMGDFAFPCFRLSKALRKPPVKIALELLKPLQQAINGKADLSSVHATGPYLNFRVNKAVLAATLIPAILEGSFLARRGILSEKVMIEYSQPNTHKAFHVGHTRNVALGDALVRIFEWCGHEVVAANYIGDEGAHIAKCLWYYQNYFVGKLPDSDLGEFLGELYTSASKMLDFQTLSQCPLPGVRIVRVIEIEPITEHPNLKRVTVDNGKRQLVVVCGGSGYQLGDLVAYAAEGARIGGRLIGKVEKHGVISTGMILSQKELGLGEDKQTITLFPEGFGQDVAEYHRIPGALPDGVSVLTEMQRRTEGVTQVLKQLEAREPETDQLWQKTKQWSMDEFYKIYDWFGARFDHYFYESDVGDAGKTICQDYYEKGLLVKSEGAVGADLSAYDLPFLLLIKTNGAGLYATKDIALALEKFETFGIDRSVYVVDVSQSTHFQQVFKTLEIMGYEQAKKSYHLAYGRVKLPEGNMSSRSGRIVLFSELREKLESKIIEDFLENFRGSWTDSEIDEAARRISIATIRYGMTNQDNNKDLIFNMEEWMSKTGNTGPYLMYAFTRTRSLLNKAGHYDASLADWSLLCHPLEEKLLNQMAAFTSVVIRARDAYRPQLMCTYLYQLAKDISRFYDQLPVLKAESEVLKVTRLLFTDAMGQVLAKGLSLLGIQTLDRM